MTYQQILSPLCETPSRVAGVHWASGTLALPKGSSVFIAPQQNFFSLEDGDRKHFLSLSETFLFWLTNPFQTFIVVTLESKQPDAAPKCTEASCNELATHQLKTYKKELLCKMHAEPFGEDAFPLEMDIVGQVQKCPPVVTVGGIWNYHAGCDTSPLLQLNWSNQFYAMCPHNSPDLVRVESLYHLAANIAFVLSSFLFY